MKNTDLNLVSQVPIEKIMFSISNILNIGIEKIGAWIRTDGGYDVYSENAKSYVLIQYINYEKGLPIRLDISFADTFSPAIEHNEFATALAKGIESDIFYLEEDSWGLLFSKKGEVTRRSCSIEYDIKLGGEYLVLK